MYANSKLLCLDASKKKLLQEIPHFSPIFHQLFLLHVGVIQLLPMQIPYLILLKYIARVKCSYSSILTSSSQSCV